jgi:hypothetical protein
MEKLLIQIYIFVEKPVTGLCASAYTYLMTSVNPLHEGIWLHFQKLSIALGVLIALSTAAIQLVKLIEKINKIIYNFKRKRRIKNERRNKRKNQINEN